MREILYRGRTGKGVWFEGFYCLVNDGHGMKPAIITGTEKSCFIPEFIIYETRGQYTGLTDKNGTKIFEGDIVHCEARLDQANMVVIFEEGEFRLVLCEKYKSYTNSAGYHSITNYNKTVIGNLYDNPELLKEVEE